MQVWKFFSREGQGNLGPPPPPFSVDRQPPRQNNSGWITITGIILFIVVVGGTARQFYTDWLWFDSLEYLNVYLITLVARAGLFAGAGLMAFLFFITNVLIARAIAPRFTLTAIGGDELRLASRMVVLTILGIGLVLALVFGSIASGEWWRILSFFNRVPFGVTDPVLNEDVAFYVFNLPVLRFVQSWLTGLLVATLLGVVAVYAISLILQQASRPRRVMKVHVSLIGIGVFLVLAFGYWLDRYNLLFSTTGATFGAGYTDINARLPVLTLLMAIAVASAVLLLINMFMRGIQLPLFGVVAWAAVALIGGGLYPEVIQRLQVEPNELARERPYIEQNIKLTREAFGLNRIEEVPYPGDETPTVQDILGNPDTVNNIRLWDHEPLKATYEQIQAIRRYYEFHDVDIDRYTFNGQYRQVMLSARELAPDKLALAGEAPTWVNQRLKFTHGYGLTLSPVNEINVDGLPNLLVKNLPPVSNPPIPAFQITRPEVYFGEKTTSWAIVNTEEPELDYASEVETKYTHYGGKGGVLLDSIFKRLMFAWQFTDPNILLTALTPDSRILYTRAIQERVMKIAPFLTLDSDPYVVIHEGRLVYIQDAYTVSNRYPYSEPYQKRFNYIRNSVKAVVDAYDGSVQFYVSDDSDPIVRSYLTIFPGVFKPLDQMPPNLKAHLRYPEMLFNVQSEMYQTYHMQDPQVFYNKEDAYTRPLEMYLNKQQPMDAYYVIMRLPKHDKPEFMLILPFTPVNKNNANAWLAGRSDGADYGKLLAFSFPKERLIYGPRQVEARIDQDSTISQQFALWNSSGARVLRGNLLFIPIGDSYLYVEPIYLQSRDSQLPELARVVVAAGNRIAMEQNLESSLNKVYGQTVMQPPPSRNEPVPPPRVGPIINPTDITSTPTPGPSPTPTATPSAGSPTLGNDIPTLARQAQEQYNRALDRQKAGDWAGYGAAVQELERTLQRMVELAQR